MQAGIKIGGRNINNRIFVDDITLTAESEEELKSHLMRVKEESERADSLEKTLMLAKTEEKKEKGIAEDEMAR